MNSEKRITKYCAYVMVTNKDRKLLHHDSYGILYDTVNEAKNDAKEIMIEFLQSEYDQDSVDKMNINVVTVEVEQWLNVEVWLEQV